MTRASDTAKLLGAGGSILGSLDVGGGQIGGRRNIVINGAMQVAQRSASVTGIGASAGYFTCDRWNINTGSSAGRLTMTQTADGPVGFANCIKLDCTTADTSIAAGENLILQQSFEGQDLQAIGKGVTGAKEVTLSFYVKANAAFDFVAEWQDNDNSRFVSKLFATTTDWVRHEITFPADVDDGSSPFDDDNANSAALNFWLHAGTTFTGGTLGTTWNETAANRAAGIDSFYSSTDNNFFITGVQLEVGSVATPFEHRSFGEELLLCQRYMQVIRQGIQGWCVNTNGTCLWTYPLQPKLRAAPTITCTETAYRYGDAVSIGVAMTSISISASTYNSDTSAAWTVSGSASATPGHYRNQLLEPTGATYGSFHFISEL